MTFTQLHQQPSSLLICNVWDVATAKVAKRLNFKAIGTSSAAISASNGLNDGENLSFDKLVSVVSDIYTNTLLPLTVDMEAGYSRDPHQIVENIKTLANVGVVGINIEDSLVDIERTLVNAIEFAKLIVFIKNKLSNLELDIFINVRIDTFLLGVPDHMIETKRRIKLYEEAGADGIFVPCIEKEEDIKTIVSFTDLPINVMCMPNLPDFTKLNAIGVKRISMGGFLFDDMLNNFEQSLHAIEKQQSFNLIF